MHVRVGPVSAGSTSAWVAYGRDVLARARSPLGDLPALDPAVADLLAGYLEEWDHLAGLGDTVVWVADVPPEEVEFLTHAFFRLASHLAAEAEHRGYPAAPAEADEFYQCLVAAVLDAMEQDSPSTGEFGEQLRQSWPGLKDG